MDEKELKKQIERGITTLRGGGVVAFPTDTVYGLGASIYCEPAVERIYRLKQRSRGMALPLLVSSVEQLETLVRVMPAVARRLLDNLPSGDLTLVLLAFVLALASLSLGFLISAAVRKSATAVGIALFLWLLLVFFGAVFLLAMFVL